MTLRRELGGLKGGKRESLLHLCSVALVIIRGFLSVRQHDFDGHEFNDSCLDLYHVVSALVKFTSYLNWLDRQHNKDRCNNTR